MASDFLYIDGNQSILKRNRVGILLSFFSVLLFVSSFGQDTLKTRSAQKTVIAGEQYDTRPFHQWLWGKHYRTEWNTPVKVPVLVLDSIGGGITAYEAGGGRQTQTLKLRDAQGREYVLRSIDKSFGKALPEVFRQTFIEKIVNDQVSIGHPFAAITIAPMAEAAKIYHSNPVIGYVPEQNALGEFNKEFGNDLYLFEQRADGNWEGADNFANSRDIKSTDKMFDKVFEESDHRIDQLAFIRARLFDMFIGDWGRHEDQWRWAEVEENGQKIYKPIPRDRDQAYTKFDGLLLKLFLGIGGTAHLQTFEKDIDDIARFNHSARNLDRQAANETTREQWVTVAAELQKLLTDEVIVMAVKQLPPELYPISGYEITEKLKARRDRLPKFASDYYAKLARQVEIVGTKKRERFEITRLNEDETLVSVYDLDKDGNKKERPFYSRTFSSGETDEIRIYGLADSDQYIMKGQTKKAIPIRIIGGPAKDVYADSLVAGQKHHIKIYDDHNNDFKTTAGTRLRLSENDSVHLYKYNGFRYSKRGLKKIVFYSNEDRIHVGLGYKMVTDRWRKLPFASSHEANVKYSINENAFSTEYKGTLTQVIGKWNVNLYANYDWIRWINYFGVGNETERVFRGSKYRDYYRMRTRQLFTSGGISRGFADYHNVGLSIFYQNYDIVHDKDRFVADHPTNIDGDDYNSKSFGGAEIDYLFQNVDDVILPMKGVKFATSVSYTHDVEEAKKSFGRFSSALTIYVPLSRSFVYYLKTGGATLAGTPEFYQLNVIGGGQTLRGHRRFRFYGKSIFYAQNEIQWIRPVRWNLFNGKAGLLALTDMGRVWYPGEKSNKLHIAFGGGFILSPFNKISVAATYARSKEDGTVNFRFGRSF